MVEIIICCPGVFLSKFQPLSIIMNNINLPPGCLIRQAKQKDIWKLLFLPLESSGRNRNFQAWVNFFYQGLMII